MRAARLPIISPVTDTHGQRTSRPLLAAAPWIAVALTVAAMIVAMKVQGRVWFSTTGVVTLWWSDVWSAECSQQFADPYSVTHVSHGLIFAGVFAWLGRTLGRRGFTSASDWRWQFAGAIAVAAAWEAAENSAFVIERYRSVTMSLEYLGDSVFNAVGDLCSCALGFFIARRLGVWKTALLFVASELLLLWLIRDNLTLNVVMLISPIDAIKQWQVAGSGLSTP
jgi:Protein of unknown function (DUF2585)